jgi:hypothetical protein
MALAARILGALPLLGSRFLDLGSGLLFRALLLPLLVTWFRALFASRFLALFLDYRNTLLRLRALNVLRRCISHTRLILSLPLGRGSTSLIVLLLKMLPDGFIARLITIMLAAEILLLFRVGIAVSRVLSLVGRQRCTTRC